MTGEEEDGRWLQQRLDGELAEVHADRRALAEVLAAPAPRPRWWRAPGTSTWLVATAAAAVVVVAAALAVPLVRSSGQDTLEPADPVPGTSTSPVPVSPVPTSPGPVPTSPMPTDPYAPSLPSPVRTTPAPPATSRPPTRDPAACSTATSDPGGTSVDVDLDGDGTADALSYSDGALRVRLGDGRGEVSAAFSTAGPYVTVLAVETDGSPGAEVLIGTRGAVGSQGGVGARARLYDLTGCRFAPVQGVNGRPYDVEVGAASESQRSGVVCDGDVLLGRTSALRDGVWQVTDTPVSSRTGTAVNGTPRRSTVPDGTPQAQDLTRETCHGDPQSLG